MWKDFKNFALKGNVLDLAFAVVIGAAFGKIVTSLVGDIITPVIGLLSGGIDLEGLQYTYGSAVLKYGVFLQSVIDFFIIAFSLFLLVRIAGKFKRKREEAPKAEPAPTREEVLLSEIRDLLKNK
ncbi:large conductance mechanosensitive channel protein MscL [Paenibacillus sp. 7124]|uniref:Large-conductance mechanosensitive channel n=1 Tax=Paenibacillus apii TaxID=1850370 RepID=A0A6M1PRT4_9BACL|nr:large conductance mechanosensitive channel protein MscL [Paenibacillus apii]NGM82971.1 large conductance mechanosensitive channel protein MscL [Paenibacillus apii]NJJ40110.1 large conductance mechanosensitive channel protein MscL [Paenibacillus apii]